MKKFLTIFAVSALVSCYANAVEVLLPHNAGRIDISHRVVTVLDGTGIADGEYKVTIDGSVVTVVFTGGKGSIKQ